jgi:hypothetical protein
MRKFSSRWTLALAMLVFATPASAGAYNTTPVQITSVRVYSNGSSSTDVALINTSAVGACSGTAYSFPIGTAAGQGMLANAITALSTGQRVTIEVSNTTGCTQEVNWGPSVQSLTLLASGNAGPW